MDRYLRNAINHVRDAEKNLLELNKKKRSRKISETISTLAQIDALLTFGD